MKAGRGGRWACTWRGTGFQRAWEVSGDRRASKGCVGAAIPRDAQEVAVMEDGCIQCSPPQRHRSSRVLPGVGVENLSIPRQPAGA